MEYSITYDRMIVKLPERIDALTAPDIEREMAQIMEEHPGCSVQLDAGSLMYISSSGLRLLMKLRNSQGGLVVTDVSRDVYDILEMTGFVEI